MTDHDRPLKFQRPVYTVPEIEKVGGCGVACVVAPTHVIILQWVMWANMMMGKREVSGRRSMG